MDNQAGPSKTFDNNKPETSQRSSAREKKFFGVSSDGFSDLVHFTLFNPEEDEEIDDSDADPDYIEESDNNTDSEQGISDNESEALNSNRIINDEPIVQEVVQEVTRPDNMETDQLSDIVNIQHLNHVADVIEEVIRTAMDENEPSESARGYQTFYYGKRNKTMVQRNIPAFKWKKTETERNVAVRSRRENIVTQLPGLKGAARNIGESPSVEEVWSLLVTDNMLEEILQWTNAKIEQVRPNYANIQKVAYLHNLDMIELKGFIGLLIYTAIFKSGNESVLNIFATDGTGREIFRCVMTKERFLFILTVLRFDNPADRAERKKSDKAAAISSIFSAFIENCQKCYTPGAFVCVDEMLVPFRGRSSFRMYMPQKPAKYRLKIQCLTDAKSHYLVNAYMYTSEGSDGQTLSDVEKLFSKPTQSVLRLVKPIMNTGRNVTGDNWFGSIPLAEELKRKRLTYLGTLRKNKLEIPAAFLPHKDRPVNSSLYGFTEDLTLLSYVPKTSKAVILLSSMHHGEDVDEISGKPEMIAEYNRTKGGVDTVDQLCANYCCSRRTKRWPMVIFFCIINISAGVNGYILHQAFADTTRLSRLNYMKGLAHLLVSPLMRRRLVLQNVKNDLVFSIKRILNIREDEGPQDAQQVFDKKKTCATCPPRIKRKTKYPCQRCKKPQCLECAKKVCLACFQKD